MAESAQVHSVEALRTFRAALLKFASAADVALADAEGEMSRALIWLQNEQPARWRGQLRQRQEALVRAKEALRMKTLFKDSSGRSPSADDERKAVLIATRRVEEAEQKLVAIRKWTTQFQKEFFGYQGAAQRLAAAARADVPRAAAMLDQAAERLERYVSLTAEAPPAPVPASETLDASMRRPAGEDQSAGGAPASGAGGRDEPDESTENHHGSS